MNTNHRLRCALESCVELLQDQLRHADNDAAAEIDAVLVGAQSALSLPSDTAVERELMGALNGLLEWGEFTGGWEGDAWKHAKRVAAKARRCQ